MSVDVSKIPDSVLQPLANVADDMAKLAIDQANQANVTAPAVTAAQNALNQAEAIDAAAQALIGTDQQHTAADAAAATAALSAWTTPLQTAPTQPTIVGFATSSGS